ncbi:plasmid transfer protein HtdO [Photorhabdus tasmaniensis]
MGKVTFLTVLSFGLFGVAVFTGTSLYYRAEYIPKRNVVIIPDDHLSGESDEEAFQVQTIILNDPTLATKFVGQGDVNESKPGGHDKSHGSPSNAGVNSIHKGTDSDISSSRDNWPRAGEPYIVPQMTESERNIKVKRFQQPKSGVNHGY